jgi:capsule polysaccharide export protein KpsE/RkpR
MVTALLVYGVTWLMPSWYRARAVILPPEETEQMDTGLPVQRFLSRMPSLAGLSNYYTPSDIFRAILQSRTVHDAVIRRFGLTRVYRTKSAEKTLREFRSHLEVAMAPDGTITIAVEDRSRQRAADVTNALIAELDRFNVERRNFAARRTRQFLERRVAEMDSLSDLAGRSLRAYQERHHIVTPIADDQSDTRAVGDLLARKIALEVELGVLRSYLREDNERVVQGRNELERVKEQIQRLPRLETEVARLTRDYRLYQQAYTLLAVQLEDARIRESMDTPTVTVLDPAMPPERRARPIRTLWAAAALVLATLGSVLWSERPGARGITRPA